MTDDIERERIKFERIKLRREIELKREALALRRLELERGSRGEKQLLGLSPSVAAAVFAAIFSFLGVVVAQWFQGRAGIAVERERNEANLSLEKQKVASGLVVKALESYDSEESGKALLFLVDSGLLEDKDGKIRALVNQPDKVPALGPVERRLVQLEIQVNALECQLAGKTFDLNSMKCVEAHL